MASRSASIFLWPHNVSPPRRTHSDKTPTRSKSQRLLSTVRNLVHRPTKSVGAIPSMRSTAHLHGSSHSNISTSDLSRSSNSVKVEDCTSSKSSSRSTLQPTWTQRGQTPGMDDYLTLAELENVWVAQDTYVGCVQAPVRPAKHTYSDVAEIPTVSKRRRPPPLIIEPPLPSLPPAIPLTSTSRPTTSASRPSTSEQNAVVNGVIHLALRPNSRPPTGSSAGSSQFDPSVRISNIHPALRPTPYFSINDMNTQFPIKDAGACGVDSRFATTVPTTDWTYGRV